jgi:hypothetical protein
MPTTSNYTYDPSGGSWTFSPAVGNSGSGIALNGSGFGNPTAPQGSQVAFLQANGTITQTMTGLSPGSGYTITFSAAQRMSWGGTESWNVCIDGNVVASFSSATASFVDYTAHFTATSTSHVLSFVGTTTGDDTVFLDNVRVTSP